MSRGGRSRRRLAVAAAALALSSATPAGLVPAEPALRGAARVEAILAPLTRADRMEFSSLFGGAGSAGAYAGARITRTLADWAVALGDPNQDYVVGARTMAARAWDLIRNDPTGAALSSTLKRLTLGSNGLVLRSLFQADRDAATSDAELASRRAINDVIARASKGSRIDAGGQMTRVDLVGQVMDSMAASGNGIAVRCWKPRPTSPYATCYRVIDPARITTPDDGYDTDRMFQGFELDEDGAPIAIHVRNRYPGDWRSNERPSWTRIPFYGEDGLRTVLHLRAPTMIPGQILGVSMFSPLLVIGQHMAKLAEAFVVAKRAQACNPTLVKTDNPEELARAMAYGSYLGPNFQMRPGMVAITNKDNEVVHPTWTFQGDDYKAFIDANLRAFTAAWGLPMQFVMQELTEANLASAQVALDQADVTATAHQNRAISQVESHIDEAYLREAIGRGELSLGTDDVDLITAGRYVRPRKPDANKQRTREAAQTAIAMGVSLTTAFGEMGYDLEDEVRQRKQDLAFLEAQGVDIPGLTSPLPATPAGTAPAVEAVEPVDAEDPEAAATDAAPAPEPT